MHRRSTSGPSITVKLNPMKDVFQLAHSSR